MPELLFRPIDRRLLCGHLLLERLLLLSMLLDLIADQGTPDQAYRSANPSAGSRMTRHTADYSAQAGSGDGPDPSAFLGCR